MRSFAPYRLVFFLAARQLWERKLLNGIAVSGVALGVLVLIAMNGIMQGFQVRFLSEITRVAPHVTVYDKRLAREETILGAWVAPRAVVERVRHAQPSDRPTRIARPTDTVRALESLPGVEAACASLVGQGIASVGAKDLGVDLRGIDPGTQDRCTPLSRYVVEGSWRALATTSDGVALGASLAENLGAKLGDRVRVVAPGGAAVSLKVVALLDTGIPSVDRVRAFVNLRAAQAILHRPDTIGRIEIRLRDPDAARGVAARVERLTGYDAESWQETNANFLSLFSMQNRIVAMQIGAILTVGGFGILAVQIMIVLQKTRDIAILRSVGLRRRDILWTFLLQGMVVALVGAIVGDLAGWRLLHFLGALKVKTEGLVKSDHFLIHEDPWFYVYGVVFAVAVGVVASLIPALRGARVEPVDVLRGQAG
jgi:lipoprotein-releasing system permease protein